MTTATSSPAEVADALAPRPDWRRFWRVVLAVVAPVPGLALAISNGVTPESLGGSTADTFAKVAAHPGQAELSIIFSAIFAVALVPSGVALMMATRRVAPKFTTLAVGFATLAFCTGLLNPGVNEIALVTARNHLDTATGIRIADEMTGSPITIVAILPFFLTITIGRIVIGVLLWRVRIAPRWMAVAMLLATPVEFVGGVVLGNVGPTVAYVLTAIGFASASVALWRMSNDEFDLPPLPR